MTMFETAAFLELMEKVRDRCHQNSKDHGFWDEGQQTLKEDGCMGEDTVLVKTKPWNFGEKVALIHTELSEMFEAWRKRTTESDKDITIVDLSVRTDKNPVGKRRITAIEEEMADVFIRLLDLAGKLDIDVGSVILAKMDYNATRSAMHGGRRC